MSLESRKSSTLEDPGAELLEKMTTSWDTYGRIVIGVVAVVVLGGLGTWFWFKQNAQQEDAASKKLIEANMAFFQGDFAHAKSGALEVAKSFGSTASGVDAHRLAGDAAFWSGDSKGAIPEYKAYLERRSTGAVAMGVKRSLAYALDNERQYADAAKLYEELAGAFDRETSGEMLAGAARCYEAVGKKAEAVKALQRLIAEYGDASYANRARVKLAELGSPDTN